MTTVLSSTTEFLQALEYSPKALVDRFHHSRELRIILKLLYLHGVLRQDAIFRKRRIVYRFVQVFSRKGLFQIGIPFQRIGRIPFGWISFQLGFVFFH